MRRTRLLLIAILGLATQAGCKNSCGEREGLFHRMVNRDKDDCPSRFAVGKDNDCRDSLASSRRHDAGAPNGWIVTGPAYPTGEPIPLGQGFATPENELPLPRIAPPGVPAQPSPAVPNAARLPNPSIKAVADAKAGK